MGDHQEITVENNHQISNDYKPAGISTVYIPPSHNVARQPETPSGCCHVAPRYSPRLGTIFGVIHMVLGLACVIINIVLVVEPDKYIFTYFGPGFWGGALFIATGALTVLASLDSFKTQKTNIAVMVTSSLSVLVSVALFMVGLISTLVLSSYVTHFDHDHTAKGKYSSIALTVVLCVEGFTALATCFMRGLCCGCTF